MSSDQSKLGAESTHVDILFVGHDACRTGAPIVLLHFLRWLKANSSLSFELFLRQGGALESEFASLTPVLKPAQLLLWNIRHRLRRLGSTSTQRDSLGRRRWGLVYSNTITNGKVVAQLASHGCAVITHVHEMEYWIQHAGVENFEAVKRQTSHFIAASQAAKENLVQRHKIAEDRVSVVHEFIANESPQDRTAAVSRIRQELGIPGEAFVLGGSGAEFWRKGRDLVAHLLVALRRRKLSPEVHFVWVGHSGKGLALFELQHDLSRAGVAAQFHSTGEVSNPLDYFAAIDAFALLSRDDPFPLVCLEAASLGKPILCFDNAGGMPEFVGDDCGFVVPYLDIEAMADRVMILRESKQECERLGLSGQTKVSRQFTVEALAPKLLEIIEKVRGVESQK